MTEDEAKTKVCCGPQILTLLLATNDARVTELVDNPGRCIGSACMAWRWGTKPNPAWEPYGAQMSWSHPAAQTPAYIRDETTGGCGLAGVPQ